MFGLSGNNDQRGDLTTGQYNDSGPQAAVPSQTPPTLDGNYESGADVSIKPKVSKFASTAPPLAENTSPDPVPQMGVLPDPVPPPSLSPSNSFTLSPDPGTASNDSAKPMASPLMDGHSNEELLKMKQQALQSLAPLIDHLEQTPEEKFKTTMMLIQASDNAELVKEAYQAADQISDDKTRAAALLDVINEINYFTKQDAKPPETSPS
ncbi:hypothetical protein H0X09_03950 [Candidatus Saccharibacteria bacterium]|nr:hypothetical protein [Candidatus Saccharibacteria bacterium]